MVPAHLYDDDYFRACCAGSEEWSASEGTEPAPMYEGYVRRAGLRAGEVVLDMGAGRGELVAVAARLGARAAVGVEYSPAATALARQTIDAMEARGGALVVRADVRLSPVRDASVDVVTLLDIVEHLSSDELDTALREARRALRPGGRVLVHTMPHRSIYDISYRALRLVRRSWPADPRNEYEHRMHVNEQSLSSLKRALRGAGFSRLRVTTGVWVYTDFLPATWARRAYRAIARIPLASRLTAGDLWGEAWK